MVLDKARHKLDTLINDRVTAPVRTSIVISITAVVIAVIALIVAGGNRADH